jgi:hypothetical protein
MKLKIGEQVFDSPESLLVGDVIEAETHLGFSAKLSDTAGFAVALFVAMRHADPDKHGADIAAAVRDTDMVTVEEVEEGDPLPEAPKGADPEQQPTSGPLRSVSTA